MSSVRPLISVIIPTYNHGAFIGAAIESVLRQTYDHLEVIVIDNHSDDNTSQVLAGISDPRLRAFRFDKRVIAASRNFGVKQSGGEVLAFLDADDQWMPDKLERQLPHLADAHVRCVGTNFVATGERQYHKRHIRFDRAQQYRDYTHEEIALGYPVMLSSALIRAGDFREVGGFDERRTFMYIEDWELWLRMAHTGVVRILSAPLLAYRIFRKKNRDRREISLATLTVLAQERKLGYLSRTVLEAASGNTYLAIGRACLEQKDSRARSYYYRGLRQSVGLRNKLRAVGGLFLCCTPHHVRELLLELYYRMPLSR